jgi:hypothetical protein
LFGGAPVPGLSGIVSSAKRRGERFGTLAQLGVCVVIQS